MEIDDKIMTIKKFQIQGYAKKNGLSYFLTYLYQLKYISNSKVNKNKKYNDIFVFNLL